MKQLESKHPAVIAGAEGGSDAHTTIVLGNLTTDPATASPPAVYFPSCGTLCDIFWWTGKPRIAP